VHHSPELSGLRRSIPLTGREPVISGQGSKLLANRRGAYESRNLEAILCHMTHPQLAATREWVARVMRRKSVSILPIIDKHFSRHPNIAEAAWLVRDNTPDMVSAGKLSRLCRRVQLEGLAMLSRDVYRREETAAFFACYALANTIEASKPYEPSTTEHIPSKYAASPTPHEAYFTGEVCKLLVFGAQYTAASLAIEQGYRYRINSTGVIEFPAGPKSLRIVNRTTQRAVLRGTYTILNRRDERASPHQRL